MPQKQLSAYELTTASKRGNKHLETGRSVFLSRPLRFDPKFRTMIFSC